jgi:hypothetical protein
MERERRTRTRVPFRFGVVVTVADRHIAVETRNISLKGVLCSSDSLFRPGQNCLVTLNLTPESQEEIVQAVIQGRIVRTTPQETAIDFVGMEPESFQHLKRIVEYHSGNPEAIAQEMLTRAFPEK